MGELQIKYVARSGSSHAITEVGGDGWRASTADVMGLIKSRANTYFTRAGSSRAEVRVVAGPSGEHLQSVRNGVPNDNLLNLPGFPESGSPAGSGLDLLPLLRAQLDADIATRVMPELKQLLEERLKPIEAKFATAGTRMGANERSLAMHGARVKELEEAVQAVRGRLEAQPKLAKGQVVLPGTSALATGSGDRDWTARVTLPAGLFAGPPEIAVSLYRVEFEAGRNARIHVEANNVTTAGFNLRCMTWLDTHIPTAAVQWIAIGA